MLNPTTLFLGLLYLRTAAAIVDMRFGAGLSPLVSAMTLAYLLFLFLRTPSFPEIGRRLFFGFVIIDILAIVSMSAQPIRDSNAAVSFILVTMLYAMTALQSASMFRTRKHVAMLYRFCLAYLSIGSAMSLLQMATGTGLLERATGLLRAYGVGFHPVDYGMQIVIVLVLMEVCRLRSGFRVGAIYISVVLLAVASLYLTQARTAWLMLGLVGFMYFYARSQGATKILAVVGVAASAVVLIFFTDRFADLTTLPAFLENTAFDSTSYDWRGVESSMAWRIVNWALHYRVAWESPWLGYGPGQSREVSLFHLEMHNAFLEYFIEVGLLGVATLVFLVWSVFRLHKRIDIVLRPYPGASAVVKGLSLSILASMASSVGFLDQTAATVFYILVVTVSASEFKEPAAAHATPGTDRLPLSETLAAPASQA